MKMVSKKQVDFRSMPFSELKESDLNSLKEKNFQVGHIAYCRGEKYYDEKRWANIELDSGFISPTSRNWSVQLEIGAPPFWHLRKPQWERI